MDTQEIINKLLNDIRTLATISRRACEYCKHYQPCLSKECALYVEGIGAEDQNGYMHDWERSCEDFDYGTCPLLENTPCTGCIRNNYCGFEYKGM